MDVVINQIKEKLNIKEIGAWPSPAPKHLVSKPQIVAFLTGATFTNESAKVYYTKLETLIRPITIISDEAINTVIELIKCQKYREICPHVWQAAGTRCANLAKEFNNWDFFEWESQNLISFENAERALNDAKTKRISEVGEDAPSRVKGLSMIDTLNAVFSGIGG